jgi:adenylate cyclase
MQHPPPSSSPAAGQRPGPVAAAPPPEAVELDLARWLAGFALASGDEAALLQGFCARLLEAGLPLLRVSAGYAVFHPVLEGRGRRWHRDAPGVMEEETTRRREDASGLEGSPFSRLAEEAGSELRRTLGTTYAPGEFAMLDAFVRRGCTDYLGVSVGFGPGSTIGALRGLLVSFQTDRPGGCAEEEVALLRRLVPHFAHASKAMMTVEAGRMLVTTYLGRDPGRRVLEGTIRRGLAEPVRAVLWSSDLMGFTRIADSLPADAAMALLNDHAEAVVDAIGAAGGEVLKFIGDGILAIFPEEAAADPCARALDAAEAALAAVEAEGARRAAAGLTRSEGLHLALHCGEVLYGNIGGRERLDFTVIGPAVNELARIEGMCRTLDQRLVASAASAAAAGPATRRRLVSLGRYALRGVRRPQELFTLDPEALSGEGAAAP